MTPKFFRQWRKRLGLTQAGAAALLDLSPDTIKSWEYGRRNISMPRVLQLACDHLEDCLALEGKENDQNPEKAERAD